MMYMRRSSPPSVKGNLSSVPPRGMPYTAPPSCASHPATIMPACSAFLLPYAICITSWAAVLTSMRPGVPRSTLHAAPTASATQNARPVLPRGLGAHLCWSIQCRTYAVTACVSAAWWGGRAGSGSQSQAATCAPAAHGALRAKQRRQGLTHRAGAADVDVVGQAADLVSHAVGHPRACRRGHAVGHAAAASDEDVHADADPRTRVCGRRPRAGRQARVHHRNHQAVLRRTC